MGSYDDAGCRLRAGNFRYCIRGKHACDLGKAATLRPGFSVCIDLRVLVFASKLVIESFAMAENTAFSTAGEDAITRSIDVDMDQTTDVLSTEEFQDYYEIAQTAEEIEKGDYKKVSSAVFAITTLIMSMTSRTQIALQFPDELLHDSVPIFRALKSRLGQHRQLYVLADTSYGRCVYRINFCTLLTLWIAAVWMKSPHHTLRQTPWCITGTLV